MEPGPEDCWEGTHWNVEKGFCENINECALGENPCIDSLTCSDNQNLHCTDKSPLNADDQKFSCHCCDEGLIWNDIYNQCVNINECEDGSGSEKNFINYFENVKLRLQ